MHKHHKIPKHAGGTDTSSNIEQVTVEQHADRHRVLFEIHGRWQDKLAWLALSKQVGREEIQRELGRRVGLATKGITLKTDHREKISKTLSGQLKSAATKRNMSIAQTKLFTDSREREKHCKRWEVTTPDGAKEDIINLEEYCKEQGLNRGHMSSVASGRRSHHRGYLCKLLGDY